MDRKAILKIAPSNKREGAWCILDEGGFIVADLMSHSDALDLVRTWNLAGFLGA